MKRTLAAIFFGLTAMTPCFGWGDDGHKIIATIATAGLSEEAAKKLREILGDETVADAAVWADKMRSNAEYDWIKPLHYINVPRGAKSLDMNRDGANGQQIVSSINKYRDILKNPESTKDERLLAVRLLFHFVGDIHQPFHVSYKEDLGGNKLTIQAFGRKSNMHKVWDSDLINRRLKDTKGGWAVMSADLRESITAPERKKWTASADPAVWANESFSITRQLYSTAPTGKAGIDDVYFKQWLPTLNTCLEVGGVRLGALLNDALDPGAAKDVKGTKGVKNGKPSGSERAPVSGNPATLPTSPTAPPATSPTGALVPA
jgi:hypothetical protein